MKTRIAAAAFALLAAATASAHPPVSVAVDRQGYAYYSDLAHVWKVAPDGTKTIAVPNVHTHELFLDAAGNLYGEHLWYEGERTDRWGHYVWRRAPDGKVEKVIPDREGFLRDYSFVRDAAGAMYFADEARARVLKHANGKTTVHAKGLSAIRWMIAAPDGTIHLVDGGNLVRIARGGTVTVVAKRIASAGRHSIMGLWTDRAGNVYAAVNSEQKVMRIARDGKVTLFARSGGSWRPCGGAFAPDGDLLLLEASATNQVRLRRIER